MDTSGHKGINVLLLGCFMFGTSTGWAAHIISRDENATFTTPAETPGLVTYPPPLEPGAHKPFSEPYQFARESLSTFQFLEVPWHFSLGPSFASTGGHHDTAAGASLRYQFSPLPWDNTVDNPWHIGSFPLSLSLELGGVFPHTSPALKQQGRIVDGTSFSVTERMAYEAHFGVVDELPHGHQNFVWPEFGLGGSMAGMRTNADIEGPPNFQLVNQTDNKLSPWVMAGLHFFPTRFYSANLGVSFFHYSNSFEAQGQSFNTSLGGWKFFPSLQIQIVWPSHVHLALTPKRLPPWLMPAYTTEDISPWVASPEVAQDPRWNKPGEPFGNVMFQFKSRYVDKVELIGDFTDWMPEKMVKDRAGYWVAVKDLPPGRHLYNYIIDGKKEIKDPWNKLYDPDNRTRGSSIVIVPGSSK